MPAAGLRSRRRIIPLPCAVTGNWAGIKCGTWYFKVGEQWLPAGGPNVSQASNQYFVPFPPFIERKTCDDELHGRPPYNTGGPLTIVSVHSDGHELQGTGDFRTGSDLLQSINYGGFRECRYVGGFLPIWPAGLGVLGEYTDSTKIFGSGFHVPSLAGWGPEAWARSAPKIELASGLVFAREARDIPRMLRTTSNGFHEAWKNMGGDQKKPFMTPKKASDQFLNQQFGWSPFLGDLHKFYDAYHKTDSYMDHMSKYNNRWKVYRRTLEDEISDTKLVSWENQSLFVPNFNPTSWAWFRPGATVKTEIREQVHDFVTSSGSFKFFKPEFDKTSPDYSSVWNTAMRTSAQYGIRVSPSNIWRSTPWTWLVDWGLNVGRSIDRLNEYLLDGVVSKYLYVMHHRVRSLILTSVIPFKSGDVSISHRIVIDVKLRRAADSPYGFGLSWDQLSAKRIAILLALGMSRPGQWPFK